MLDDVFFILPKAVLFCPRRFYFAQGGFILPKAVLFCPRRFYFALRRFN